jgi:para-aminobenzoate synthetase component 1
MSIKIDSIATLKNQSAHTVFAKVEHLAWAMLLDTCNNRLSDGRYDIIVYQPSATYQFKDHAAQLTVVSSTLEHLNNIVLKHSPFEDLSALHAAFVGNLDLSTVKGSPLPFLFGAMGLFGYDVNVHTDAIRNEQPGQYQLDDIAVGFYEQSLIFDNYTNDVFHVSIDGADPQWLTRLLITEPNKAAADKQSFRLTQDWQANMSEAEYCTSMARIDDYLQSGDCYQINFAQRFSACYRGSEWLAYKALTAVNKAPFSSFIRFDNSCVLSVSPERFISVKDRKVSTKPIKGTRKRAQDPVADKALADELLSSEKDRAENLMIVDLLRNDLSKHCKAHSVKVPHLFALESYPAVHHMVSTVVAELKDDASPFDLLCGAFPGGSITGAPKVRAMQIIQELEPDKRSIYCGSIGYVGIRQDMDTNICIRTILAENNIMHCWAGGGIVLDSQAQDEYQESFHKVTKILPTLANTLAKPLE